MDGPKDQNVPSSPWPSIPILLEDVFERYSQLEAIVDGDTRLSFLKLGNLVQSMAAALQGMGLTRGDIVVLWGENSWRWEVTALACWWSGLVVVPLSHRLKSLEILPLLEQVRPRAIFGGCGSNRNRLLEDLSNYLGKNDSNLESFLSESLGFVDFCPEPNAQFKSWDAVIEGYMAADIEASQGVKSDDMCLILYTSGTTGQPKGVVTSHGAFIRNYFDAEFLTHNLADRTILSPPLSHIFGQSILMRSLIYGACQVFPSTARSDDLAALIRQEGISTLSGPPSLFQQLLLLRVGGRPALEGVRIVTTGASSISEKLVSDLYESGVEMVRTSYGLTEYPRVSTTVRADKPQHISTTVGRPTSGTRLKLVDNTGSEVPSGSIGEILVSGHALLSGYYTENGTIIPATDAAGWFHTGDLGRIRQGGYLQIVGRKKEMFISHGFNVYPVEVENLLLKSGMLETAAVIGRVAKFGGEEGVAIVVPKEGSQFEMRKLREWARDSMTDYKIPTRYVEVEALPLNANGKVDKLYLSNEYSSDKFKGLM